MQYRPRPQVPRVSINQFIRAFELRVIDENGQNLGVIPTRDALSLAQMKGLDLIEIAPSAKPPVARIMSFDKYRYQEAKKAKEIRSGQKKQEQKQVRIGLGSALNDLMIKAAKVEEFLNEGHYVEIMMALFGREKGKRDLARVKLNDFLKLIKTEFKITSMMKFGMKGLLIQIVKK